MVERAGSADKGEVWRVTHGILEARKWMKQLDDD